MLRYNTSTMCKSMNREIHVFFLESIRSIFSKTFEIEILCRYVLSEVITEHIIVWNVVFVEMGIA